MKTTWTVFRVEKRDPDTKKWVVELFFMMGEAKSFQAIDFNTDWRFCEVKDKRKNTLLFGDVDLEDGDWPIRFPLKLKNGLILENGESKIEESNKLKVAEQDDWIKKIKVVK